MPSPPLRYMSLGNSSPEKTTTTTTTTTSNNKKTPIVVDLSDVSFTIQKSHQRKEKAWELSRQIQIALIKAWNKVNNNDDDDEDHEDDENHSCGGGSSSSNSSNVVENLITSFVNKDYNHHHHNQEDEEVSILIPAIATRESRDANLSNKMEDMVKLVAYQYFIQTGCLLSPKQTPYVTDEEYIAGACMGLCNELSQYGQGRAIVRDIHSVQMAKNLVSQCYNYLLQFDFRNGPLRKKYDTVKYSLRSLETLLYELAITTTSGGGGGEDQGKDAANGGNNDDHDHHDDDDTVSSSHVVDSPKMKKARKQHQQTTTTTISDTDIPAIPVLIPTEELDALRKRIEYRDEIRETLIKKCRDGQKMSKQAIYALHRGHDDIQRSYHLMDQCRDTIIQQHLYPIIKQEPTLRYGSYSNVLEEYVEARLFATWLYGRRHHHHHPQHNNNNDDNDNNGSSSSLPSTMTTTAAVTSPSGIILQYHDFNDDDELLPSMITITPEEYIGGLCDLTGEIGRYAVQRGTVRDIMGVRFCWETNHKIFIALSLIERLPTSSMMGKKMDTLRRSVDKLERMLYEMSLSEAAGGRSIIHNTNTAETTTTTTGDNMNNNNNNNHHGDDHHK